MLGSYFDLKREIARIAARRAAAEADKPRLHQDAAYSDFDDRLQTFVRSFLGDEYDDEGIASRRGVARTNFRSKSPASGDGPKP